MNRWVVFGLLALALIVLVSPGIVGMLAERNLRHSIDWAGQDNDNLVVTQERFDRGWFTAEGRHRVELGTDRDPGDPSGAYALVIDTRIDHGLVPVTSLARDAGSLKPALADTVSVVSLDLGQGRLVELPGRLHSRIGLTGETASHYLLQAGSVEDDGIALAWQGADVRLAIDAVADKASYDGRIEPLSYTDGEDAWTLGVVEFDGNQRQTPFGFSTGSIVLRMADTSFAVLPGGATGFRALSLDARSELAGDRVDAAAELDIEGFVLPAVGTVDAGLDFTMQGLDAAGLMRIRKSLAAGGSPTYPHIDRDFKALLAAGADFRVERFHLALPDGEVEATMHFALPETDRAAAVSWPGLLLALEASLDVRVPAALVQTVQQTNPEAGALVAMGILKREGDAYVMRAEYARGLVNVNGAPMPIPFELFSGSRAGH